MTQQSKQVIDFRASKGITTAQSDEHQRRWSERGWDNALAKGNYDPTREHLNFEIVRGGRIQPVDKSRSIPQLMRDNLRARGIEDPNEGLDEPKYRTVVNFIFGGSRDRMHELAFGNQKVNLKNGTDNSHITRHPEIEAWAQDVYRFVSDRYGEDNIVAFYVHLDEMNPHIHCTLLPITNEKKFSYRKLFVGEGNSKMEYARMTTQLHTDFSRINCKWGLERGTSIRETGARHRSTEDYRRWLDEVCITRQEELESYGHALADARTELKIAERRVKGLTTMVENATRQKEELESKITELSRQLDEQKRNGERDVSRLQSELKSLHSELDGVTARLDDKMDKLDEANDKLNILTEDIGQMEQRRDSLREENNRLAEGVQQQAKANLSMAMFEYSVNEFSNRLPKMSDEMCKLFDGTLIKAMAEKGNEVMTCALMLYVGFVDRAVSFAQGHGGGGGGGSSLPWGRREDEDEREWSRRCMMMAKRLMRPSESKKQKR